MGFTEEDVEAIERLKDIEGVAPSYSIDVLAEFEGNENVVKIISFLWIR